MSEMADHRPLIADLLDALGRHDGAETLRYAATLDEASTWTERDELEHLRGVLGDIKQALDARDAEGRRLHPGRYETAVRELLNR